MKTWIARTKQYGKNTVFLLSPHHGICPFPWLVRPYGEVKIPGALWCWYVHWQIRILRIHHDGDTALISSVMTELRQDSIDWHGPLPHNCKDAREPFHVPILSRCITLPLRRLVYVTTMCLISNPDLWFCAPAPLCWQPCRSANTVSDMFIYVPHLERHEDKWQGDFFFRQTLYITCQLLIMRCWIYRIFSYI